ncbi:MAG TPA: hypothetical protein VFX76_08600, partial [Roseiflexaceae bacterium]|nr:hypothetical protein [Roseiflexaceae bacterium]
MPKSIRVAFFVLLALGLAAAITWPVADGNLTLASGDMQPGDLVVLSGNVTLAEGSRVGGSMVLLCCNLIVDGEIGGGIAAAASNVSLGPRARVGGALTMMSGNLERMAGSRVEGGIGTPSAGMLLALVRAFCLLPLLLIGLL